MFFASTVKWIGNFFLGVCVIFFVAYACYDIGLGVGIEHGKAITMEEAFQKGLAEYNYTTDKYSWVSYDL